MSRRAACALIGTRLRADRRMYSLLLVVAAIAGYVLPRSDAGPFFFGGLFAILMAQMQEPGRHPDLDRCELCAPLFGRHLARAKAAVPCIGAALAIVIYWIAQALHGLPPAPPLVFATAIAAVATALVSLGATVRERGPSLLYLGLACATTVGAYLLTARGWPFVALTWSAAIAFIALRQYGESLARYDPV